jgi:ABC-type glycerol-3-phosphate transport system permease component
MRTAGARDRGRPIIWLILVMGSVVMILPFAWLVTTSFKKPDEIFRTLPRRLTPRSVLRYALPKRQFARVEGRWHEGEVQEVIPGTYRVRLKQGPKAGDVFAVSTEKIQEGLVVVPEEGVETFTPFSLVEIVEPVDRVLELYGEGVVPRNLVTVAEDDFRERVGFSWRNYQKALTIFDFIRYTINTVIVVGLSMAGIMFSASLCAYGFARLKFKGRDLLFGLLLATMMLPGIVLLIPNFHLWKWLGGLDTYWPLTFPYFFGTAGTAFYIFLLRQFFRTIPEELSDAARIDGCSEFMIYWRIILPLSKPALATVAIFTFMGVWNDFIRPLIYLFTPEKYTLALGLAAFKSTYAGGGGHTATTAGKWHYLMAASTIMVVPVVALFFSCQKFFVKGITLTGMKG